MGHSITPTSITHNTVKMAQNGMYWVFTLNNPASHQLVIPAYVAYAVWQAERGVEGTEHLQGYVELTSNQRLTALKKWLPTAHWERRKGTQAQAVAYCRKEESRVSGPWEHGVLAERAQGARSDLASVRDAIRAGETKRQLLDSFPEVVAKYPRFIELVEREVAAASVPRCLLPEPRQWQTEVLGTLSSPPDDRTILWVFDPVGNVGKTHFAKHLVDCHDAFYCNGGKGVDILFAYTGQKIVVFDYVRDAEEFVNYGPMEQIKNGLFFSHKYESVTKRFDVPHVLVLANFFPDTGKLSRDRLRVTEVRSDFSTLQHDVTNRQ